MIFPIWPLVSPTITEKEGLGRFVLGKKLLPSD
jgi:hypothetical protein